MITDPYFDRLGIPTARQDSVRRWLDLLSRWNAHIDLTAARSHEELYDLMLADATLLAKYIPPSARVVDVGTGAGAPGLALALLRPDLKLTLVEPLRKRIAFLRTVIGTLERFDIELSCERVDFITKKRIRNWDVAISRATLAPEAWVPLGLELAPVVWALLAQGEPPVIERAKIDEDVAYRWPLTLAVRRAVRFTG